MKVKDVIGHLEKVLPSSLIEEGDNCGLLIGDLEQEIHHIRTALEASEEVLDKAIEDGVDMLVVHHPMIYSPLARITSDSLRGRKALKLIQNGIALYAAHSNLDRAPGGLNQRFGTLLGFQEFEAYDEDGFILLGKLAVPESLEHFVDEIKEILGTDQVRYVGDRSWEILSVAFCTGSGMSLLEDELFDVADVYITGDLKYHDAMDVHEAGYAVIDVGHFGSEVIASEVLYDLVTRVISSVEVSVDRSIVNPIKQ